MQACALTDIGKVRSVNQDYVFCSLSSVGSLPNLFLVADGMGGHKAGDYASRYLVEHLIQYIEQQKEGSVVSLLKNGISSVNKTLYQKSLEKEELSGMGSTLVGAVICQSNLYVANIGDSRLYLIRDGIEQITKDHSYVEELVSLGKMDRNSEDYQNKKNIITRAVGTSVELSIDFFEITLKAGDLILLCSDGLTNMITDEEIKDIIQSEKTLEHKAKSLIDAANARGGRDNTAVIVVEFQINEEVISC